MRKAFEQNFVQGKEIGAAVAAWVDGELVVNLWAGTADEAGTRPWQVDTVSTVLSGTKGLTSTCVHQLVERGDLDLNAPVARYWPEFAQAGKEDITLGMVMSHRSGVIGPRQRMDWTAGHRLGSGVRTPGRRRTVVGAGNRAGLPHDHFRVHPRRGVPPRHR